MVGRKFDEPAASRSQKALIRLASVDPIELCNEAKVELCRATRDLRSCGRCVERVIISCGHAALCEECSQRFDACPICRTALAKGGNEFPLRLYYECIEAGLISRKCDDRLQNKENGDIQLIADVQRLYALFDAALENNLASLICHYVADVCMDESAVSSDPIIAFLLDEKVVKDWCTRMFKSILTELQEIYNLSVIEMKGKLNVLLRISSKLSGLTNVLEVLESSLRGSTSAMLQDLSYLLESVLRTKQHLDIMSWCARHQFLEEVSSRYSDYASWQAAVRERKSAAVRRAWPDPINHKLESNDRSIHNLFIEDALSNLDSEQGYVEKDSGEFTITSLLARGDNTYFRSKLHGMADCYPFENLRVAVDLLFLRGNSDMVVAKQAIFLYFLFDRHWRMPEKDWRYIVDDFAVTFGITRHSLLESFVFYLLDDDNDYALKEAIRLLPEISGPNTHPKVAQVLLERENPDAALMVLRWSGRDGGTLVSIGEAVTAVWVRVESGLLTEAFMYQRMICMKIKDRKPTVTSEEVMGECCNWQFWLEVLVNEICSLCIRRKLVDRMIGLPWNSDEEKHLHKCLFDYATDDPLSIVGSLLVVFYLQRYRYFEAYQLDCQLQALEEDFISKNQNDEILYKIRSMSHWRKKLVGQSVELLPDVVQQQLKSGNLQEGSISISLGKDENILTKSDPPRAHEPVLGNLLFKAP